MSRTPKSPARPGDPAGQPARHEGPFSVNVTELPASPAAVDAASRGGDEKSLYKPLRTFSPIAEVPPGGASRGGEQVRPAETSAAERGRPGLSLAKGEDGAAGGNRD